MNTAAILSTRFREVILDGTWIANTNYKEQLTTTSWEVAITKIGALNSIGDIARHIHYYLEGIKDVFGRGNLEIKDKYSFDFPPLKSQSEWENFLSCFWADAEAFAKLIEQISEDQLKNVFVEVKYGTVQRNIEGMIEHSYYHLGQIVLIRKLIAGAKL